MRDTKTQSDADAELEAAYLTTWHKLEAAKAKADAADAEADDAEAEASDAEGDAADAEGELDKAAAIKAKAKASNANVPNVHRTFLAARRIAKAKDENAYRARIAAFNARRTANIARTRADALVREVAACTLAEEKAYAAAYPKLSRKREAGE